MRLFLKVLILIFVVKHSLFSQTPKILTYEEAVNIALTESYTIKSHAENKKAMQFSYNYYKAMFKPRLDLDIFAPSWNESIQAIQTPDSLPVYNSAGSMQFGGILDFTYMLPTGGNFSLFSNLFREDLKTVLAGQGNQELQTNQAYTRLGIGFEQPIFTKNTLRENLKVAELEYEISSSYFTRAQMDIIYNVTEGFYNLLRVTREMEIANQKLSYSGEAFRIASLKFETGRIPEGDVLIAEVEVAQDKARLSEVKGNLERVKDDFKQLIGLDLSDNLDISTEVRYDTVLINLDKAIEEALQNRLELYEADLNIELQEIQVDRAKREREFRGHISAYYGITGISTIGDGNTSELFRSSFDNFVDRPPNMGITFTLSYPIHDWGRGKARVQQARVRLKEGELFREDMRNTVIRQVRDIVRTVQESRERLEIHKKNQSVAIKSYEVSMLRFENGDITSQDLANEQEKLSEVQLAYLDAFITYKLSIADLNRKTMWDFKNNRSYLIEEQNDYQVYK